MEMQHVKTQVRKVFTPVRLKKAAALAVLVGIVTTGGAYYHHQQAQARSSAEKQARAEMIAAQAARCGVVLLDEAYVRTIAAEAIGKDESELNFRTVQLEMKDGDRDGKHDKHRDRKHDHKGNRADRWEPNRDDPHAVMPYAPQTTPDAPPVHTAVPAENAAAPMTGSAVQPAPAPAPDPMRQDFCPVYKVTCNADHVKYKLRIDAITGKVVASKVDVDDDIL